jgi:hypothetical protein
MKLKYNIYNNMHPVKLFPVLDSNVSIRLGGIYYYFLMLIYNII